MNVLDVGRGSKRYALPNGTTIGEGWVNDPQQAYNFAKAGIKPEFTGEYEGVHGEGVAGARPGLSAFPSAGALGGLKAAMGGGGDEDAPGTSLMRRLTSSPDMAARYGLIARPEDLDAQTALLQNSVTAGGGGKTATQRELEAEDLMARRSQATMGLREAMAPRESSLADYESERGARRLGLPEAVRRRGLDQAYAQQDWERKSGATQDIEDTKAAADIQKALVTAQASGASAQKIEALKALSALMEQGVKSQTGGSSAFSDQDMQDLHDLILAMTLGGGARGAAPAGGTNIKR